MTISDEFLAEEAPTIPPNSEVIGLNLTWLNARIMASYYGVGQVLSYPLKKSENFEHFNLHWIPVYSVLL
jgi:hypothetical protein